MIPLFVHAAAARHAASTVAPPEYSLRRVDCIAVRLFPWGHVLARSKPSLEQHYHRLTLSVHAHRGKTLLICLSFSVLVTAYYYRPYSYEYILQRLLIF